MRGSDTLEDPGRYIPSWLHCQPLGLGFCLDRGIRMERNNHQSFLAGQTTKLSSPGELWAGCCLISPEGPPGREMRSEPGVPCLSCWVGQGVHLPGKSPPSVPLCQRDSSSDCKGLPSGVTRAVPVISAQGASQLPGSLQSQGFTAGTPGPFPAGSSYPPLFMKGATGDSAPPRVWLGPGQRPLCARTQRGKGNPGEGMFPGQSPLLGQISP